MNPFLMIDRDSLTRLDQYKKVQQSRSKKHSETSSSQLSYNFQDEQDEYKIHSLEFLPEENGSNIAVVIMDNGCDDDYGFCGGVFDDDDDTIMESSFTALSRTSSFSSTSSKSYSGMHHSQQSIGCDISDVNVICEIDNNKPSLACRTFYASDDDLSTTLSSCSVSTAIEGLRLVQDESGEDCEYKVRLRIGERDLVAW
eukprot:CAMPEP_0175014272 /NCGR_PEP_ID=MMETSP0005-20121125/10432_1 /TAXON_ID=420556 /ORGANISM="Ochromonas sp., Strain CCMP1393" /LENGTH=198 /DNA_ID=CAMNT_0016270921 /DNA_START=64 /DNA_END=657 /DNA_ORIENTATION=+